MKEPCKAIQIPDEVVGSNFAAIGVEAEAAREASLLSSAMRLGTHIESMEEVVAISVYGVL